MTRYKPECEDGVLVLVALLSEDTIALDTEYQRISTI